jgi:hypothetical protein
MNMRRSRQNLLLGMRNAGFRPFLQGPDSVPQYASLAEVEAALLGGRLTRGYELLLSEKMARGEGGDRVLALLDAHGIAFTVSAGHWGDAIASRAERRPS